MLKKTSFILLATVFTTLLSAHEFWLQPDKFRYKWNEPVNIKFLVGQNFNGNNWSGNNSKINSLNLHFGGVSSDLSSTLGSAKGDSLQLVMTDEGTAMVTFNSTNSFIELKAGDFNAYLVEDGLPEALSYRTQHGETDSAGREYYQRSTKTIFQVGTKLTDDYKKPTSLPLDIIPQSNPYGVTGKASIGVTVLFQGQPLAETACKVWHYREGKTSVKEITTDANGQLRFEVEPGGRWMVSTVKMMRLNDDPKAQWQSYWGSLTWGYY
jgi:uncharacterized GH25 family protein